jgi:hypothetical protein
MLCVLVQAQLAGGEYDPTSTKVLHFVSNPAAEVARLRQAAELDRLTAENEELRAALKRAGPAGTRTWQQKIALALCSCCVAEGRGRGRKQASTPPRPPRAAA